MNIIEIHLTTKTDFRHIHVATAVVDGQTHYASSASSSPIPKLARQLVELGYSPETPIMIRRGTTSVTKSPTKLAFWASINVTDNSVGRPAVVAHRPFSAETRGPLA